MGVNRTFSVSVQTTKPKSISVKSNISQNEISAKGDTSLYYSELAKDWAIGEGLIQGEDYSSKTYAQTAFEYAEQGKVYLDGSTEIYANLQQSASDNITTISGIKEEAIAEVETVKLNAINEFAIVSENAKDDLIEIKDDAVAEINATVETVVEEIDSVVIVSENINNISEVAENLDDILNKTVEVGDTLTSEAGTSASVENVGTKFAPVLEFTIPQGARGKDGGMTANYDSGTLSFYSETGDVLNPHWGKISGDITQQADLQAELAKYLKGVVLTQADYDALEVKDANTLYFIEGE